MYRRRWFVLGSVFFVFVAACSGDEGTTGSTTTAVQVTTSATVVEDPVDPFIGRWLTIDADGLEVEIAISPRADNGYAFLITDSHLDACVEFGAPVIGFVSGHAEATGSEIRLDFETLMCRTDWGDVDKAVSGGMVLQHHDGVLRSNLPSCYRQGPAEPCEGVDPPEPIVADPDIDFLVAEYGLEWVQDNYRGDSPDRYRPSTTPSVRHPARGL